MPSRARKLALIYYAALGPIVLWSLYAQARNHGALPVTPRLDDVVLAVAILSGGFGTYLGLPGARWVRAIVTAVYLLCMTWLVLFVGVWLECSLKQCQ
jgi:hypothetical protein